MPTQEATDEIRAAKSAVWASYPLPLLAVLIVLILFVFFFAPATVTLDGYSHLYGGQALRWMLHGTPQVHGNFSYNSPLLPNWLCGLLLAALSAILPGELALKLVLALTGAALLGSLYFCIDATRYQPRQRAKVLIVLLPFALNAFLTLGFYGFLISSSICIFVLGLLLRYGLAMPLRLQCAIACLLLLAYFSNPLPVIVSFLFPCAYFIAEAIVDGRAGYGSDGQNRFVAKLPRQALALWPWLPPACLLPWFYFRLAKSAPPAAFSIPLNVKNRILEVGKEAFLAIAPTSTAAMLFNALLAILFAGIVLSPRKLFAQNRLRFASLAALLSFSVALFFLVPEQVGDGSDIFNRFLLYTAIFLVLLALSGGAFDTRLLTLCSLFAALSVLAFAGEYWLVSKRMAPAVAEVNAAMGAIPRDSRILILGYRMMPSCGRWSLLERTAPEDHWALAGALRNQLLVMNDYQANTSLFPLYYLTSRYAGLINDVDLIKGRNRAAWLETLQSDPGVDFIVSWGTPSGTATGAVDPPFEQQLKQRYDLLLSERGVSRVQLWRRR